MYALIYYYFDLLLNDLLYHFTTLIAKTPLEFPFNQDKCVELGVDFQLNAKRQIQLLARAIVFAVSVCK